MRADQSMDHAERISRRIEPESHCAFHHERSVSDSEFPQLRPSHIVVVTLPISLTFNRSGKRLACLSLDRTVRVWEPQVLDPNAQP